MNITMLGTGNALVTECYNTCFILENNGQMLLVDGGGGNTILHQLKVAGFNWMDIRHIFVTHKHLDHIIGVLWMVRMICQFMNHGEYKGEAYIYSHVEVLDLLREMAKKLLPEKDSRYINDRLHFVEISDGEKIDLIGCETLFFDIHSSKAKQFGFCMNIDSKRKLTCCGDEPLSPFCEQYAAASEWLLHEAFCLHSESNIFDPYEKHHSTVKDACEKAEALGIKNLLLYHTEDKNLANRKKLYLEEGQKYYKGKLWIPDDFETIKL